ncbi:MAG: hypothetical protein MUF12_10150 [Sediminibacterium sp.]|jgi:hypothetical protein|nr:hypothetical protein [Sediminibacterium sp.]
MKNDFFKTGIDFFNKNNNSLKDKGFTLNIGEPTKERSNNSLELSLKSTKIEISIIIWELGSLYFGGVDWEKDDAWNDNFTFDNDDEMIYQMKEILERLI